MLIERAKSYDLACGDDVVHLDFNLPENNVIFAKAKCGSSSEPIEALAKKTLDSPIGTKRLRDRDLNGKSVAILVDDKTRPTPANRLAPIVLDELKQAGVSDKDILFVIACGLHTPEMPLPIVTAEQQIESKLGRELVDKYKVITHDGYHWDNLQFIGFSGLGTPLWINKAVAKADFRVAIGRICPHSDPGYEGGGKMILPGVSSMESVMHNHRMCCSPRTGPGTLDENPVRTDMDEIGKMAKLDFILNMVSKPGRGSGGENIWNEGFAGDSILAHRCGVEFGDKNVWGAEIGEKADITIAFPGPSGIGNANLTYAKQGTKPTGTVIYLANEPQTPRKLDNPPHWWYTQEDLRGCDLETIVRRYQHFKIVNPEDVWITDGAATGASRQFHSKDQELVKISSQSPSEIQKELDTATAKALEKHGASARIVVLSDGNTLPLQRFHIASVHA